MAFSFDAYDPDWFKKMQEAVEKSNEQKKDILAIINPWYSALEKSDQYSTLDNEQKKNELWILGKFLLSFDNKASIHDPLTESPDAIIKNEGELIGVEITELFTDTGLKKWEGTWEGIFDEIKAELNIDSEKYNGNYRLKLISENISLKNKEKKKINAEILEWIRNDEKPSNCVFFSELRKTPCKKSINFSFDRTFMSGTLERELVDEVILSKEEKVQKYRENTTIFKQWLLITIGGLKESADYSFMSPTILSKPFESNFDKIFLFNSWDDHIEELAIIKSQKRY